MNEKVTWEDVKKIFDNRNLSGSEVVYMLREIFSIEFFQDIIRINEIELKSRKIKYGKDT